MVDVVITNIYRLEGEGTLKAFCDIIVSDSLIISGIRIVEGRKGLFVSMPSKQGKDGKWYESIRPVNREVRDALNDMVIKAFNE